MFLWFKIRFKNTQPKFLYIQKNNKKGWQYWLSKSYSMTYLFNSECGFTNTLNEGNVSFLQCIFCVITFVTPVTTGIDHQLSPFKKYSSANMFRYSLNLLFKGFIYRFSGGSTHGNGQRLDGGVIWWWFATFLFKAKMKWISSY